MHRSRELPRTDDLAIPHAGDRQAPVGGQGAEQTSAGGIPQPDGEEKTRTIMEEPPGSEVESQPGRRPRPGDPPVQGLQGGGGGGHTP